MKWKETTINEQTGKDGAPLYPQISADDALKALRDFDKQNPPESD